MAIRKSILFSLIFFAATCLSGCDFVVAPSGDGEGSKAVVSIQLGTLAADVDGNVSRAIVQGNGYLYIRTMGGPTGDHGPFYGPYNMTSGKTFSTSDIPPGDYSAIFVMYSGKKLDTAATYPTALGTYTFRQLMSLPDDELMSFMDDSKDSGTKTTETEIDSTDDGKDALGDFFDGQVSMGGKEKVSLPADATTNLSMTLMPITSEKQTIKLYESGTYTFASGDGKGRFFRLEGIGVEPPVTAGYLSCKLFTETGIAGSIGKVAFYDGNGQQVATTKSGTDLASGIVWKMDPAAINAAADEYGYVEIFAYVEYTGTVQARFVNTVPPVVFVKVDGEANASWQGHKVLFGIYDQTAIDNMAGGASWVEQNPVGLGVIKLDSSSGDGAASVYCYGEIKAGVKYYISAQVDSSSHYSWLENFMSVDIATVVPYKDDLVMNGDASLNAMEIYGFKAFMPGEAVSLAAADFSVYTSYVTFVSDIGGGDGSVASSPTTLPAAITAANARSPSDSTQIYLVSDIFDVNSQAISTTSQSLGIISGNVSIQSFGRAYFTLKAGLIPSTYNFFNATGALSFERVRLDASTFTSAMTPLVVSSSYLSFGPGTSLKGYGGSSSSNGGGVYVGAGATFDMKKSSIQFCSSQSGSAIYSMTGSTCNLDTVYIMNNSHSVAGNGAICTDGIVNAKNVVFSGNTSNENYVELTNGTWNDL